MQSDFFQNFEFLGVFLSFKFLKFFFAFYSLYHYTKTIDQEKRSRKCRVTFFKILNFKVLFLNFNFLICLEASTKASTTPTNMVRVRRARRASLFGFKSR